MDRPVLPALSIVPMRPAGLAFAGAAALLAAVWTAADIKPAAAGEAAFAAHSSFAMINDEVAKNDDRDTEKITGKKGKKKKKKTRRKPRGGSFF